jgi:hypothetical protein
MLYRKHSCKVPLFWFRNQENVLDQKLVESIFFMEHNAIFYHPIYLE